MADVDLSKIPQPFKLNFNNPVTLNATATIQPSAFDLKFGGLPNAPVVVDLGLDDISLEVSGDPTKPLTIDAGLDKIGATVSLVGNPNQPVAVDLGLDNINAKLALALTQIPAVRINIPTQYEFAFNLLGLKLFSFCFSGITSITTEENVPIIRHSLKNVSPAVFKRKRVTDHVTQNAYTATITDSDGG